MENESNPGRYRELSAPKKDKETLSTDVDGFIEDVKAARIKWKIADISLVIRGMCVIGDDEGAMIMAAHLGDTLQAEAMLAHALGQAQSDRESSIARALAATRKRK